MGYNTDLTGTLFLDKPLSDDHKQFLKKFAEERHDEAPGYTFPGAWCQWVPTDDGTGLEYDGGEKFYHYTEWVECLIKEFLIPWGYTLNGTVLWYGDSSGDCGYIIVKDNEVRTKNLEIYVDELNEGIAKILSLQPTVLPLLMGINESMDQIIKDLLKGA